MMVCGRQLRSCVVAEVMALLAALVAKCEFRNKRAREEVAKVVITVVL
jgi:hypothetical protein